MNKVLQENVVILGGDLGIDPYSFENSLETHFSTLKDNQLVDRFYSLIEEVSSSYDELLKYKISQMLKMIKRELIKRDLEI